jgi:Arc/MetJ family transcription regulator
MLIDIDDGALARAAVVLGTSTKDETVNRALQLVAERASRETDRERFDELLDLIGDRLAETDARADAWRQGR